MKETISDLGVAPTFVDFNSPSKNNNIVGIPLTPNFVGKLGSSSMLCLAIVTSFISSEISSKVGAIWVHGPHQVAQKSINKIVFSFSNVSNVSSVDLIVAVENI